MEPSQVKDILTRILVEIGVAQSSITDNANFSTDLGLDSLDVAELVMKIESNFGISISAESSERMASFSDAVSTIQQLQNLQNKPNDE